jgi:soluble lytic murein transglycosylase-like protein
MKILIFIVVCLIPVCAYSGIYGYVDETGVHHFTNIKPVGKKYQIVIPGRETLLLRDRDNTDYDSLIMQHSEAHGLDPSLIKAVMRAESNFNPHAVSQKGAQGLMQLMPDTAKLMRVDDPFDPDDNIRGGTKYLKMLEETFQGDLELMLAAYNAGPRKVMEHNMSVPPIEETRNFVKRVKHYYQKLKNPHEG